jgi:hypothetical protein
MGELVSSLPNLVAYNELGKCPESKTRRFITDCKRKRIVDTLQKLQLLNGECDTTYDDDSDSEDEDDDKEATATVHSPTSLILMIFQTFQNLKHITMKKSRTTFAGIETSKALSHLAKLETLDLSGGNRMFFNGDRQKVNEWLTSSLPLFPQSLKAIDFSDWEPVGDFPRFDADWLQLGRYIEEEICEAIPGVESVNCTPYGADDDNLHHAEEESGVNDGYGDDKEEEDDDGGNDYDGEAIALMAYEDQEDLNQGSDYENDYYACSDKGEYEYDSDDDYFPPLM